ncbi:MAG: non-canonical purine NTP pyrophosphatase [Candidatus Taylorbacteria bacterium]|nr:non-canonical purine NTP pyrophosphatase [Candidatus Taylorbacteria bacterium]
MKLLIATKNPGKAREIKKFLGDDFELISLTDLKNVPDVEETGKTFAENAILKAKKYFEWSGIPCVADDAGLEIDYLNGEPGVKSRRWLGYEATDQELIDLALTKLKDVPKEKRTAHLVAVGAYYDGKNLVTEKGSIDGYIVEKQTAECEPGYPFRSIFFVPKFHKLYQDLTHEEHEKINHRKKVYSRLAKNIASLMDKPKSY